MTARKGVAVATTMPDLLKRTGTGSLQEGLAASLVVHSVDLLSTGGIALSKAGCVCGGGGAFRALAIPNKSSGQHPQTGPPQEAQKREEDIRSLDKLSMKGDGSFTSQ